MGTAFPLKKLSGNGVPTREVLRLFCIITIKFLTVNKYVTTFNAPQTISKLDIRICKALEIVPLKHISKGTCSIYRRRVVSRAGIWWKITARKRTTVHYGEPLQTVVNNCNPQFTRRTK